MAYKIVVDSCCDLPEEYRKDEHFAVVPLTLVVDDDEIIDDETFDQLDFLRRVKESKNGAHSACPSPQRYIDEFENVTDTDIYVVTLSSKLSGSYNAAVLAGEMYKEDGGTNKVHVFDSRSAAAGEVLIAFMIERAVKEGLSFEEVVDKIEKFRAGMGTYFVLETLEVLRKNGRLSNLKAALVSALNIKPIMAGDDGSIVKLGQSRGMDKALAHMVDYIKNNTIDSATKTLVIAHCNAPARAAKVKELIEKAMEIKEVVIVDTAGVSSLYAYDGGIVVSV